MKEAALLYTKEKKLCWTKGKRKRQSKIAEELNIQHQFLSRWTIMRYVADGHAGQSPLTWWWQSQWCVWNSPSCIWDWCENKPIQQKHHKNTANILSSAVTQKINNISSSRRIFQWLMNVTIIDFKATISNPVEG